MIIIIIFQIHGEVNILHDLVLAFVECGRLRQARRILETPGLQARSRRLRDACERYVQVGRYRHRHVSNFANNIQNIINTVIAQNSNVTYNSKVC